MNDDDTGKQPLLVELFTEELPPKALRKLGSAFAEGIRSGLAKRQLLASDQPATHFATPRRLAAYIPDTLAQAPEQTRREKLMPVSVGIAANGQSSPALRKKLVALGLAHLEPADLTIESDGKRDYLFAIGATAGTRLADGLREALDYAVTHLPIPKVMRYQLADGVTSVRFVRPAHSLLALWGTRIVPVGTLGLNASNLTRGHRFMAHGPMAITSADTYQRQLLEEGKVVASFDDRRAHIDAQLRAHAHRLGATLGDGPEVSALLDEVTALVEYPAVYVGEFDREFLAVPPECLILTMRLNQKYFPLFEPASGKLTHQFLIVSNMRIDDPSNIVEGNQRVVRPRLADAQFFFQTDRKTPLASRVEHLDASVYHNKLGSQLERVRRVQEITRHVAGKLGADVELAARAAWLAKADLNSSMVGEFPELQGIMGAYYAQDEGESREVVAAIRMQYHNRIDEPVTSPMRVAAALFIAERAETLVGIWGIGLVPTGERDPYGLRRAALGVISAFEQLHAGGCLPLTSPGLGLRDLLAFTFSTFSGRALDPSTCAEVEAFIYERYRNQLSDHDHHVVDAVLALTPPLQQVLDRVEACTAFARRPEAGGLAAANKRIANLLKKSVDTAHALDPQLLREPAEQALAAVIAKLEPLAVDACTRGDFIACMTTMAGARDAVDTFFNDVMVMVDDPALRANRLALLVRLHQIMNLVADISQLNQ
ncbi:MAG: glycine--tRNA ligase subunit beta [Candidimonas sp.]|nr:MAG: glycine--tRNA ligase subunit beta [Candidimonas sp.]